MAELLTVTALTFTAAYFLLRKGPTATAAPIDIAQPAVKNTEQVTTTNIHTRMGDAIGTGAELGVTKEQMANTQRKTEVEVHVGGPALVPTKPPVLPVVAPVSGIQGPAALNTKPADK